jgi:DNA-binding XRE family transcriptional regulator
LSAAGGSTAKVSSAEDVPSRSPGKPLHRFDQFLRRQHAVTVSSLSKGKLKTRTVWSLFGFVEKICIICDAFIIDFIILHHILVTQKETTMDLQEIGSHLREARRRTGLTQAQLAASLGMSRATVSALEGGRCHEIGVRKLAGLLDLVGMQITVAPRRGRPTIDDLRAERRNEEERS